MSCELLMNSGDAESSALNRAARRASRRRHSEKIADATAGVKAASNNQTTRKKLPFRVPELFQNYLALAILVVIKSTHLLLPTTRPHWFFHHMMPYSLNAVSNDYPSTSDNFEDHLFSFSVPQAVSAVVRQ